MPETTPLPLTREERETLREELQYPHPELWPVACVREAVERYEANCVQLECRVDLLESLVQGPPQTVAEANRELLARAARIAQLEDELAQVRAQQGKLFEALQLAARVMEAFDVGVDPEIRSVLATGTPPAAKEQ